MHESRRRITVAATCGRRRRSQTAAIENKPPFKIFVGGVSNPALAFLMGWARGVRNTAHKKQTQAMEKDWAWKLARSTFVLFEFFPTVVGFFQFAGDLFQPLMVGLENIGWTAVILRPTHLFMQRFEFLFQLRDPGR